MSQNLYADLFELAPVSLWLEDYSELRRLFDRWRAEGVSDLRAHLHHRRDRVAECARCIRVLQVNRRTLELFGARDTADLVAGLGQVFRDDMLDHLAAELDCLWRGERGFSSETVNYSLDGRRLDVRLRATLLPGHEADWSRVMVSMEDVTERRQAEQALVRSEQYARGLFEHSPVSLWVEDFSAIRRLLEDLRRAGISDFRTFLGVHPEFVQRCMQEIKVLSVNQQTLRLFAAPDTATLLSSLQAIFRDDTHDHFAEQLIELWNGRLEHARETVNYALDGSAVHVHMQFAVMPGHEATWDQVLISLTDITARKKAEAYLEFLGTHDVLTQLRNRAFFNDELARIDRKGVMPVTVLVLDLNGLKPVNDDMGHAAGDALLRRAGEAIGQLVEGHGHAARIGGDEFAVLVPGTDAVDALMQRLQRLLQLNNQFYSGGASLSFAMGGAVCRERGGMQAAVLEADRRMYEDKHHYYRQHDRRGRQSVTGGESPSPT